jgi:TonB family protein
MTPTAIVPGSERTTDFAGISPVSGLAFSMALHAMVIAAAVPLLSTEEPFRQSAKHQVVQLQLLPPEATHVEPETSVLALAPQPVHLPTHSPGVPDVVTLTEPERPKQLASMQAPPAPTAEDWAFAGRYTLKNSKAYRYTWGQQVRSMMGTAIEGPDQGMVRFRVEIAPDGSLTSLETLWSTSPVAERLARTAITNMRQWPATPTGQPLVFERTITFSPFASEGPPLYRYDCLPDRPAFSNPFAWDGKSAQEPAPPQPIEKPDPDELADCLKQLPQDSIDAEMARDKRVMERWGWSARQPGAARRQDP